MTTVAGASGRSTEGPRLRGRRGVTRPRLRGRRDRLSVVAVFAGPLAEPRLPSRAVDSRGRVGAVPEGRERGARARTDAEATTLGLERRARRGSRTHPRVDIWFRARARRDRRLRGRRRRRPCYSRSRVSLFATRETGRSLTSRAIPSGRGTRARLRWQRTLTTVFAQTQFTRALVGDARAAVILTQVHLRKPCYDFYFL